MVAERDRRTAEVSRRFGKLEHRLQVTDAAVWRIHLGVELVELRRGQVFRQAAIGGFGQGAAVDDPLADARERDAHEPAPALARTASERDADTERHEVAGDVVDRGYRQEARLGAVSVCLGDAAHRLHDAVEAAALAPGTARPPGAERGTNDPGPQLCERLGRKTA